MNNFILGIVIAPIILVGYWLVSAIVPASTPPQPPGRSLSLLDINYVPTSPRKAMPETQYTETSGHPASLTQKKGKPLILHFWAPWCGVCLSEMPDLDAFAGKHLDDAQIICISNDPSGGQSTRDYYTHRGIKHLDSNIDKHENQQGALSRALSIQAYPTTIFVSAKGEEMGRIMGSIDWQGKAGDVILTFMRSVKL